MENAVAHHKPISSRHPHHSLPLEHTGTPPKRPKIDGGHSASRKEKHARLEKHGKHEKSVKSAKPVKLDGKVAVKKEPTTPTKRKPVISESESEDDIPLAVRKSQLQPAVTAVTVKKAVKMEGRVEVGRERKLSQDDVPLARRKAELAKQSTKPASTPPMAVIPPSSSSSHSKPHSSHHKTENMAAAVESPKKAGMKRKRPPTESEEDDEFKLKKAKKTPPVSTKGKSSESPKKSKSKRDGAAISPKKRDGAAISPKKRDGAAISPKKKATAESPVKGGRKKKEEEKKDVWKWWEETPHPKGVKWLTLEHSGPYFAPAYEPLPSDVRFLYNGNPLGLSEKAEEAAGFFAKMLDHDYTTKDIFCKNFFQDWRKEMTPQEAALITDWKKCDFSEIHLYYKGKAEARKNITKEEKAKIKAENDQILEEFGWAIIDGHRQRIGNFKVEPPGLFRGRGDHPKQGRIKKRIEAESVIINIGKNGSIPEPPPGHRWRAVQHDNTVTWLASWTENIQGQIKYVMLNPTSRLKGEKDWAKYETARKLKDCVDKIREQYRADWKSKEMKTRQRAVAVYFIDKLALRAGNEKDADETADTVGCCSLRVEHIKLHDELDGKENMVEFDFLGKDSIRYYNRLPVEKQVFKNLRIFVRDKEPEDDLFDRLTTATLNKHLSELMDGLTAKVFRTFNASLTLQEQLQELTDPDDAAVAKMLSYNRANRAVAILCNHQRAVPKTFDKQMGNLQEKIQGKEETIVDMRAEIKALRREVKTTKDSKTTKKLESKKKQLGRLEEQLQKLELQATDKEENKDIALGTSKLNYLDPRITVAWCKKWDVGIEKVYNKSQRDKFAWAIDMAEEDFEF